MTGVLNMTVMNLIEAGVVYRMVFFTILEGITALTLLAFMIFTLFQVSKWIKKELSKQ